MISVRFLALLLVAAILGGAAGVAFGQLGGRVQYDRIKLTVTQSPWIDPLPIEAVAPDIVLWPDGTIVALRTTGFTRISAPSDEVAALFERLSDTGRSWASTYDLEEGFRSTRATLELGSGGDRRVITIDNELNNPALPDTLYDWLLSVRRLAERADLVATPFSPSVMVLATQPTTTTADDFPLSPPPDFIKYTTNDGAGGTTRLAGEELKAALTDWVPLQAAWYPDNVRLVEDGGANYWLYWTIDWDAR